MRHTVHETIYGIGFMRNSFTFLQQQPLELQFRFVVHTIWKKLKQNPSAWRIA